MRHGKNHEDRKMLFLQKTVTMNMDLKKLRIADGQLPFIHYLCTQR